jgi:transcriptional regulator with XRE-family HTH domain
MMLHELAQRIRRQREKRGLKQQDIANALNISPQAVSKWERGENAPDIAVLVPLAQLLDVSVDWLLSAQEAGRDVFEATVLASAVDGAYKKSLTMKSRDYATWVNGMFYTLTEVTLQQGGVPIKYIGDGYLCFFTGREHRQRAVAAAQRAMTTVGENLKIGLSTGEIYLGSVGHPDYAKPDIMGEVVNIAFLTLDWAQKNAESGVAATAAVLEGNEAPVATGKTEEVSFRGISDLRTVCEILPEC